MGNVTSILTLAFCNLATQKFRTLAAGTGICIAIFLIFMQWGLLEAARKESTQLYNFFEFDIALISKKYQFMYEADSFDRVRLVQAQTLDSQR